MDGVKKRWIPKSKTIEIIRNVIHDKIREDEKLYYDLRALLWDLEVEIDQIVDEAIYDAVGDVDDPNKTYADLQQYIEELEGAINEAHYVIRKGKW
jgi:hypothetical protein